MNFPGNFHQGVSDAKFDFHVGEDVSASGGRDKVVVPDAHLLFSGEYERSGNDLVISDHDHRTVVHDYFRGQHRPALVSSDGATVDPKIIDALTGHVDYAQAAGTSPAGKVVGHVAKLAGSASIVRNGVTVELNNGDAVYQNDVVQTGSGSTIGLVMIDGTTFNLSANARLMLNDLTFDATSTSNTSLFTLMQGAASFVAGQVAKTGDMKVGTPVATVGIRGTAVNLDISSTDGTVSVSVIDQHDNQIHTVQVYNLNGDLIGSASSNGAALTLTPLAGFNVGVQEIVKTPADLSQEFSTFQQDLNTYDTYKAIAPNTPPPSDGKRGDVTPQSTTKFAGSSVLPTVAPSTSVLPDTSSTKTQLAALSSPDITTIVNNPSSSSSTAPAPVQTPPTTTSAPLLILTTATPPVVAITSSGGPTNQTNQTITGMVDAADAGATVTILDGTAAIGSGVVQPDGSFSVPVTLSTGGNSLVAQVSDAAGNVLTSSPVVFTVSTTAPTVTETLTAQTGSAAGGHITSNDALGGTGLANTVVHFTIDGTAIATTVTADATGAWSFTPTGLADGTHTIVASQTDTFGNTGSATLSFTLDTTAPVVAITSSGGATNQAAQTITGNVDVADAGTTVTLFDNGSTTPLGTATVASDGSWSANITLSGSGSHSIVAKDTDAAGNIGTSTPVVFTLNATASAAKSTVAASPTTVTADGVATTTVTVTVEDANGNLIPNAAVTLSSTGSGDHFGAATGTTNAQGVFTTTLSSTSAQASDTITATEGGAQETTTVAFTAATTASAAKSTVAASPTTVTADGVATTTVTVTVEDANGNLIPNAAVTLSSTGSGDHFGAATGTTNAQGVFTTTLSSTSAQASDTITATEGGAQETTTVAFTAATTASAAKSTVAASPTTVTADGVATTTVTVTVEDANGNLIPNAAVTLSSTGSGDHFGAATGTTNAQGVFTTTLSSTSAQASDTITATEGGAQETTTVAFTAATTASAAKSTVAPSPTTVTADGVATTTVTVTVEDANGNLIPNAAVTLSSTGSGDHFGAATGTTNAQGVFTTTLSSTSAQASDTITATEGGAQETTTVAFTAGTTASAAKSTVAASPTTVTADGVATTTVTVTVEDANGNLIPNAAVTLTSTGSGDHFGAATGTTNAQGVFTTTLSSTSAQASDTITATEGGAQETTTVAFTAATTASAAKSTVAASPTTVTADGVATTTVTVTVEDANGNLIPNAAVTLTSTGSGDHFGAATGTTNAQGVFTTTLSSTSAQASDTITATEGGAQETTTVAFTAVQPPTGGTPVLTAASDSGTSHTDGITDVTSPTFTVALGPIIAVGDTVQLLLGGSALAHPVTHTITAADIITGSVSLTVTAGDLGADGIKQLSAQLGDAFGNSSTTAALTITLDTTAPTGGTPVLTTASDSGTSHTDGITDVTAPTFTVALGSTVAAGDTVQLLLGGSALAHPVTHTVTAADITAGSVSLTVTAGDLGADGTKSITAQFSDVAGNTSTTAADVITLDTTAPAVAIGNPGGSTNQPSLSVTGTITGADAGTTIAVFDGATQVGVGTISGGTWSANVTLSNGSNVLTAEVTDAAGNTATSGSVTYTLNTTAPTGGTPVLTAASDSGTSQSDDITDVTAPTFTVALGSTVVAGDTVQLLLGGSALAHPVTHTITAADITAGSVSLTVTAGDLGADGIKQLSAQLGDAFGNSSTTAALTITLDTTAPTGGTPALTTASDSGTSHTDGITDVTAPTFTVALGSTVAAGDTVQLLLGGSALAHPVTHTVTAADITAGSVSLTVTAGDLGADGTKSITAQFSDVAGNTSTTAADVITLDTTAPAVAIGNPGGSTNQPSLSVTGTITGADAGTTIAVFDGATQVGVGTISGGTWSANVTLSNGSNVLTAEVTDAAGNTATSGSVTYTLNTTAPTGGTPVLTAASDSGTSQSDDITDVTAPTFTVALGSTVVAGDTVQLLLGGSALAHPVTHTITAADITAGSVSLTVTAGDLGADGIKQLSAQLGDAFGNSSTTAALTITLDTTAPTGGTLALTTASDSGTSHTDGITDVTAPTFTVALGSTVAAGDTVQLLLGGSALAHPVTHTVTAADITAGSVSLTVTAGDLGADGTKSITAQFSDVAGNTSTTAADVITLDTTAPAVAIGNPGGSTNQPSLSVTGTITGADAGTTIAVFDGATQVGVGTISGGTWSANVTLSNGSNVLTAEVTDAAGNTATSGSVTYTLNTTAPTGGTPVLTAASDSGTSQSDDITDVTAPTFTVALGSTVVAGDTVQLLLGGSALAHPVTHTITAADITAGSVSLTVTAGDLGADGIKQLSAQLGDAFGNSSTTAALTITLDTTAPTGGTPALTTASDSGTSHTDGITDVTAPTFTVALGSTVAAGDTVQLLLGGSALAHPVTHTVTAADITAGSVSLTVTAGDLGADGTKSITAQFSDVAGNTSTTAADVITLDTTAPAVAIGNPGGSTNQPSLSVTGTITGADAGTTIAVFDGATQVGVGTISGGTWSTNVTLSNGSNVLTAEVTDAAGNTATSGSVTYTLNTTAPTGGTPVLTAASDSGTSQSDDITDVTAPTFTVALGSTVVAGDTVQLLLGGSALAHPVTHTITAADITAGSVSLTVTAGDLGADGIKQLSAQLGDAFGNSSTTAALTITLDTTAPTGGTPALTTASDSGTSHTDGITDVTAPTFTVALGSTVAAGDTVQLLLGGSALAHPVTHTVTAADITAGSVSLTVTAGDLGADGTKSITAQFSDVAGNTSTTAADVITLDTTAPAVAIGNPGGSTNQPSLSVTGTITGADAGTTIAVFDGATQVGVGTISGGTWSTNVTLSNGSNVLTAEVTDAAGNTATSGSVTYTLNTTAPTGGTPVLTAASDSGTSQSDDITDVTAPTFTVALGSTVVAGDTVQLLLGGSALAHPVTHTITAADITAGSVSLTVTAGDLGADGIKQLSAQLGDAFGNSSTTAALTITLDTTAPTGGTPALTTASDSGTSHTDGITDVTAPTFTVALGSTVAAGDTVQLLLGGSALAHPVTHTVTAADITAGSVSLTVTAGDLGADGTKSITAQFSDVAGNTSTTAADVITLDTTAPAVAIGNPGGSTNQPSLSVTGTITGADAGTTIAVFDGATQVGVGTISGGTWSANVTLSNGSNVLTAEVTDAAGNTATSGSVTYTLNTTAPTGGTPVLTAASDSGTSQSDDITDVTAPTFTVALGSTVVAGDTVQLLLGGSALAHPVTHTITAADITAGSVSLTVTAGDLGADGIKQLSAQLGDAFGNSSTTAALTITLDTTAPTGGTPALTTASDSGTSHTDGITDVTAPTFTVALGSTVAAGDTVQLLLGGSALAHPVTHTVTAADITAGSVSLTVTAGDLGADGTKSITAQFSDVAGNTSATAADVITLDTTAPAVAIGNPGGSTNQPSLSVTGTITGADAGTTIAVFDGATQVGVGTISGGTWSANVTLSNGSNVLTAEVTDAAGNTATSGSVTYTLNTTAPTGGTPVLTAASDSGTSQSDDITDVTAPTFTVALGSTVVAGDTVQLLLGGSALAHPVTHTITAADITAGSVSLTVTAGDLGADGIKQLSAQLGDAFGNSSTTAALTITLDTTAPTGGTPALTTASDSGTSHTDGITDVTAPTFTVALGSTVAAGDTVQLLLGGSALAHPVTHTVTAADITAGSVSLTVTAGDLGADGTKSITAQFSDVAGNTSTTAADVITLDTTAPAVAIGNPGGSTNQPSLSVTGTITGADAGTTIAVFDGATQVGVGTISGGTWSANVTLSNGSNVLTAEVTDAAGNTATSGSVTYTLNTTAPTGGTPVLTAASDSGTSQSDDITDVTAPTFTVALGSTVVAGDTVQLLLGGSALAHPVTHTITAADITAGSVSLTVTAGDLGADGIKQLSAQLGDAFGNSSTTAALTITLDTTAPTGGTPALTTASDSGTSHTDGITDVTAPTFTVALGSTVAAGDTVQLLLGGSALAHPVTHTVTAADITAGSVSLTVTAGDLGADGTKSITAQFSDVAGNTSTTAADVITLDTTAPTGGTPDLAAGSDSGSSNTDGITDVTAPTFTVTLNPTVAVGDTVQLLLGGSALAHPVTHTITAADITTASVNLTVTAGDLGADGTKSITAQFSDVAGNTSTTSALSFTLDTSAPVVAITSSGGATDQAVQTITGTVDAADAGSTVTLFDNGSTTALGTATVGSDGTWSSTVTLSGNGSHSIVAKDTDAAGNTGSSSAVVYTLTITPNGWANPNGGSWNVGANWSSGTVPANTADVSINPIGTAPYVVTIAAGTTVSANSLTVDDPDVTLLDQGTLTIAASLLLTAGAVEIDNGGTLSLGGSASLTANFAGTGGNLILGTSPGFTGTISALSTADGAVTITGSGNVTAASGDAIDLSASGGTQANPSNLTLGLLGAITGAAVGIDVVQNAVGNIAIATTGPVVGEAGQGILAEESATGVGSILIDGSGSVTTVDAAFSGIVAENLNTANGNSITVNQIGDITGGYDGIRALTDGTGNVTVIVSPGTATSPFVVTGISHYGIEAVSNSTGSISVTTGANDVIISGSVGINAYNQATSIPQQGGQTNSNITVTAAGTIDSGYLLTGGSSRPAGILAGYKGGTTSTPNAAVFGNVAVNNSADIVALGGDGIRAYTYGSGNVTVQDLAGATIVASDEFGIEALSFGVGSVSISTVAGDVIDSGSSGLQSINLATAITAAAGSTVTLTARGTVISGTHLTPGGSQPQGLSAGYYPGDAGVSNTNVNGTVNLDNFANVTAAAGWGISAYNWGNGSVTVTDEANTTVSGAQFGLGAYSESTGTGSVTINVGNNATISAGALYGLAGIQAGEANAGSISITTSTGDVINSGGTGIAAGNQATTATSASQISITTFGTINAGYDANPGGGQPAGISAGYSGGSGTVNSNVAGNVIVDNSAIINAPAGAGIGVSNSGVGNINLTLESSSAITSATSGVNAYAQGGGNVTITNKGTITDTSGIGISANTGNGVADSVSGGISINNSGTITSLGSSTAPVIQINNASTQNANLTNSGTITAGLLGKTTNNQAVAVYNGNVTINNTGTISGNVSLNGGAFNNNANGIWNTDGNDYFGNGLGAIVNAGIINLLGFSSLFGAEGLTFTNSNIVNVAANGAAQIGASVTGTGSFTIGDRAELEFVDAVAAGQTVSFTDGNGLLTLDSPSTFSGSISGLAIGDAIDLLGIAVSSATVNGSVLTVTETDNQTLTYQVSGALANTTFNVLSGNEIVLVPTSAITVTGPSGPLVFTLTASAFYILSNATITGTANGLGITSSDGTAGDYLTVEINQTSSISVSGAVDGVSLTTAGANIALINAGTIGASSGTGVLVNSGSGSADVIDYGNVSASQAAINAHVSGLGTLNIVVGNGANIGSTAATGIFAIGTSSGNIDVSTMPGAIINAGTSGIFAENQGTSVGTANAPSNILVSASGTINSGGNSTGSEPAGIVAGFLGGTTSPASPPAAAVFGNVTVNNDANITAATGIGIEAFNYGVGDVSVSDASGAVIQATAANTTAAGFTQYGIAAFNYGSGKTTVTTDFGSTINSGGAGINATNQATVIAAAAASSVTVIAAGAINSGANLNNSGSAPAGIEAGYNPGNSGVFNANVAGNVLVEYDGSTQNGGGLVAGAGDGIIAFDYGVGNVEVDLGFGAAITALTPASAGSIAPYGVNAVNKGTGNITLTMSNSDTINSGSTGVNVDNQNTSIPTTAGSIIAVTAAGTITSGTIATNNGNQPSGISAGYLGASTGANTSINGTVFVNNDANISAAAGSGINAYNYGNGNVTVNDAGGTIVSGAVYGISAYAESGGGTGNLAINVGPNATIAATNPAVVGATPVYGINAFSNDTGNISVITSSGDTITSSSSGMSVTNEATAIAQSVNSSIDVTAYGTITSGTGVTGTGSPPAGITAGYLGSTTIPTNFPLTTLFGDVVVNNFATINAASGDGIRAYNYGIGDVTVNDFAGSITLQGLIPTGDTSLPNGYQNGITASNEGSGNINVMTAVGTSIDASLGASGIAAVNKAPGPSGNAFAIPATSHVLVLAYGTIKSGTDLTGSGDVPAGILAGYNPNNADTADGNVQGTVSIDDYASITAAAGTDGIRGINYGIGTISIIAEAGATITAGRYGIGAIGGDGGDITITTSATLSGSTAAIDATTTSTGTVTIENSGNMTGDVVTANATFDNGLGGVWNLAGASTFATGANILTNEGIIDTTGTSSITSGGSLSVANTGTVNVQSGSLDIAANVTGTGAFTIANGATLEIGGSVGTGETVTFQGATGTLTLDHSETSPFAGQIADLVGLSSSTHDSIDLVDMASANASAQYVASTTNPTSGVLTVSDGNGHTETFNLVNYTGSGAFTTTTDGGTGTLVFDPPATAVATDLAAPAVVSTDAQVSSSGVDGNVTFATAGADGVASAGVTADNGGAGYIGNFTVDPVVSSNGQQSVEWHFALGAAQSDQIMPSQVLSQSYEVALLEGQQAKAVTQEVTILTGGAGSDTFDFKPGMGAAVVTNFSEQAADKIDLQHSTIANFAQLQAAVQPVHDGHDTLIELSHGDTLTLANISVSQLHANNFIFA